MSVLDALSQVQHLTDEVQIVQVHSIGTAYYLNGVLLRDSRQDNGTYGLLEDLGFGVEHLHVPWKDMPHDGKPSRTIIVPERLADLKAHLEGLARKRRQESIEYHRSELRRLEAEQLADTVTGGTP